MKLQAQQIHTTIPYRIPYHTWHPIFSWKYGPKGMDRVCDTNVAGRMYDAWEHPGLLEKHFSLRKHATKFRRDRRDRVRTRLETG